MPRPLHDITLSRWGSGSVQRMPRPLCDVTLSRWGSGSVQRMPRPLHDVTPSRWGSGSVRFRSGSLFLSWKLLPLLLVVFSCC